MLSQQTIDIIKSTVPVLEVHGTEITSRFYHLLFTNHPELKNVFNQTNQRKGRQPEALANAVYAAAVNIEKLESIIPVVIQIGHKHRSLGVKPEHYPIVGQFLLQAIKDVVNPPEEVIAAWAEAYGVIADAFISVEADMYNKAEEQEGGWKDTRKFKVIKKEKESSVITSFYLQPVDGGKIASYKAGQYISITASIPGEQYTHMRQYSLSDAPGNDYYRISVKKESGTDTTPGGMVSNYLHEQVSVGSELTISAPAGDFTLDESSTKPLVLLSGGVGITPLLSMLNTVINKGIKREVYFFHGALNSETHAFNGYIQDVVKEHSNVKSFIAYSNPTSSDLQSKNYDKEGFITLEDLQNVLSSNVADFYFCGPTPFMKSMYKALGEWKVDPSSIHYEIFGPAESLAE
ncbi:NO-inducible flavohemoprotein [Bacillus sp. RG28]|uniref:Flavohemoprotein n=1 Tax=Gottfriedia endophytica TaxID=2820819 RepID=A0A940NUB2_9BACI|nr:NO-inducible flavohemoprotein [Gottfriedia endophytica]MBP0724978.1 NO-inducible flavohemoprotein [Gottfriedia endophytica]